MKHHELKINQIFNESSFQDIPNTLIKKDNTDDYDNISNALKNRNSNTIVFTSGEYIINKQLVFPSNLIIIFEKGAILKYNGSSKKALLLDSNTYIKNLFLVSLTNKIMDSYGVFCNNKKNIYFSECSISNFGFANMGLHLCTNIKLDNCYLDKCGLKNDITQKDINSRWYGQGIYALQCNNITIDNCTIVDNGMHGIKIDKGNNIKITNNISSLNGDCGITLLSSSIVNISNNHCCNNGINGGPYGGQGIQLVGNRSDDLTSNNIIISNNIVNNNKENGIECTIAIEHSIISNNITELNNWSGIAVNPTCNHITVNSNLCFKNGTNGISCLTSNNCIFNGNITNCNNDHGIEITRSKMINISSFTSNNNGQKLSNRCGILVDSSCECIYIRNGITSDDQEVHTQSYGVRFNNCNGGECSNLISNGNKIYPLIISTTYCSNISLNNMSIQNTDYGGMKYSTNTRLISGIGNPNYSVIAPIGSIYMRVDGSTHSTFYVKEVGDGNTGWIAK